MDDVIRKRLAGDCFHMWSPFCLPAATKTTSKSSSFQQFVSTYTPSSISLSASFSTSLLPSCSLSHFPSPLHLFLSPCLPFYMITSPSFQVFFSLAALSVVMPLSFFMQLWVQVNRDVNCWCKTLWRKKKTPPVSRFGKFQKENQKKRDVCW